MILKSIFAAYLWSFVDIFCVEVEQGDTLLFCFSFHAVNNCPFHSLFNTVLMFVFVGILLFKMVTKQSAKVLPSVF